MSRRTKEAYPVAERSTSSRKQSAGRVLGRIGTRVANAVGVRTSAQRSRETNEQINRDLEDQRRATRTAAAEKAQAGDKAVAEAAKRVVEKRFDGSYTGITQLETAAGRRGSAKAKEVISGAREVVTAAVVSKFRPEVETHYHGSGSGPGRSPVDIKGPKIESVQREESRVDEDSRRIGHEFQSLADKAAKALSGDPANRGETSLIIGVTESPESKKHAADYQKRDPGYSEPVGGTHRGGRHYLDESVGLIYEVLGGRREDMPNDTARMQERRESGNGKHHRVSRETVTDSGVVIREIWTMGLPQDAPGYDITGIREPLKNIHDRPLEGEIHSVEFGWQSPEAEHVPVA